MSKLRLTIKLLAMISHILFGALLALLLLLSSWLIPVPVRYRIAHIWMKFLCRFIIQLKVKVEGNPSKETMFMAGNHISWLDIVAIGAQKQVSFLAKSEVRSWPVIGWIAKVGGTLYIERGGGQSSEIAGEIVERLNDNSSVMVFPEGTTTVGVTMRRFFPRLFAAPIAAGLPVQPVAIRYPGKDARGTHRLAAYAEDDNFVKQLFYVLSQRGVKVELTFLDPIESKGKDRKTLSEAVFSAIHEVVEEKNSKADAELAK